MPSPYLAPPAGPVLPLPDAPTQRCPPPAFLLELSTPRPSCEEPTLRCAIPTILVELPELETLRCPDPAPSFLDEAATVRYGAAGDEPGGAPATALPDASTLRSPFRFAEPASAAARRAFASGEDSGVFLREILDETAAPHPLPDPSATCFSLPIASALGEFDESASYDDFEPVPTLLDNIPTLAAPQAPGAPPRWTISRSRSEGLELVLALPSPRPPDGAYALSLALRQQLIAALEARVGVSLDSPVRRDLLDEDLRLPLVGGAVRICLDVTDGETLFGAPLYHAWLAHERELARLRQDPTRPGRAAAR